jgi:hypothetical protein
MWKRVKLTRNGYLVPPDSFTSKFYYTPGEYTVAIGIMSGYPGSSEEDPRYYRSFNRNYASAGIYVYDSEEVAVRKTRKFNHVGCNEVVLKVEVKAEDWLASSTDCLEFIHLYRRVFVPEEQPYLEFYT